MYNIYMVKGNKLMENKEINLFVPGRLCLMGEHSDWAGGYRKINNNIEKGYAIVTGIEEGIYATCKFSDKFIIKHTNSNKYFESNMELKELLKVAEEGDFFSYVAGVAYCIKEQYNVGGIEITITKETIPTKKGLSSSAAICVLVARAFNKLYRLIIVSALLKILINFSFKIEFQNYLSINYISILKDPQLNHHLFIRFIYYYFGFIILSLVFLGIIFSKEKNNINFNRKEQNEIVDDESFSQKKKKSYSI